MTPIHYPGETELNLLKRFCSNVTLAAVLGISLFPSGCGKAVLTADDVAYMPGCPTLFVAQLDEETPLGIRNAREGEAIAFYLDGTRVGQAATDEEGRAQLVRKVTAPSNARTWTTKARVGRRELKVDRPIHRWEPDRVILAVDIDHTVSQTDYADLLTDGLDTESQPHAGAMESLARLQKDYQLLYITARPRILLEKTRAWLRHNGFPDAPLITARSVGAMWEQAEIKRRMLSRRREIWPNLLIGIGDKEADVKAYGKNGMLSVILAPDETPIDGPDTRNVVLLPDWPAIQSFFNEHAQMLRDSRRLSAQLERGWHDNDPT